MVTKLSEEKLRYVELQSIPRWQLRQYWWQYIVLIVPPDFFTVISFVLNLQPTLISICKPSSHHGGGETEEKHLFNYPIRTLWESQSNSKSVANISDGSRRQRGGIRKLRRRQSPIYISPNVYDYEYDYADYDGYPQSPAVVRNCSLMS